MLAQMVMRQRRLLPFLQLLLGLSICCGAAAVGAADDDDSDECDLQPLVFEVLSQSSAGDDNAVCRQAAAYSVAKFGYRLRKRLPELEQYLENLESVLREETPSAEDEQRAGVGRRVLSRLGRSDCLRHGLRDQARTCIAPPDGA